MQAGQLKTLMFSSKRTDFTMVPPMLVMCLSLRSMLESNIDSWHDHVDRIPFIVC